MRHSDDRYQYLAPERPDRIRPGAFRYRVIRRCHRRAYRLLTTFRGDVYSAAEQSRAGATNSAMGTQGRYVTHPGGCIYQWRASLAEHRHWQEGP
ncbi:hypothetical protein D3C76_1604340 [compost metagenome]